MSESNKIVSCSKNTAIGTGEDGPHNSLEFANSSYLKIVIIRELIASSQVVLQV